MTVHKPDGGNPPFGTKLQSVAYRRQSNESADRYKISPSYLGRMRFDPMTDAAHDKQLAQIHVQVGGHLYRTGFHPVETLQQIIPVDEFITLIRRWIECPDQ